MRPSTGCSKIDEPTRVRGAGGNAPLIAQVIAEKFLAEQQFAPVKQMDLRRVEYQARSDITGVRCRAKPRISPPE